MGCGLSSYLFNLILEAMMSFAFKSTEAGVRVGGQTVNNLRFTDDIDLVAEDEGQLQELTDADKMKADTPIAKGFDSK